MPQIFTQHTKDLMRQRRRKASECGKASKPTVRHHCRRNTYAYNNYTAHFSSNQRPKCIDKHCNNNSKKHLVDFRLTPNNTRAVKEKYQENKLNNNKRQTKAMAKTKTKHNNTRLTWLVSKRQGASGERRQQATPFWQDSAANWGGHCLACTYLCIVQHACVCVGMCAPSANTSAKIL